MKSYILSAALIAAVSLGVPLATEEERNVEAAFAAYVAQFDK